MKKTLFELLIVRQTFERQQNFFETEFVFKQKKQKLFEKIYLKKLFKKEKQVRKF